MQLGDWSPCSQRPLTCIYPEPSSSSPCCAILFCKRHFNVMHWPQPRSSNWSLSIHIHIHIHTALAVCISFLYSVYATCFTHHTFSILIALIILKVDLSCDWPSTLFTCLPHPQTISLFIFILQVPQSFIYINSLELKINNLFVCWWPYSPPFMRPNVSLLCSQDPDTGLYTEPDYSRLWYISSCNISFNIIVHSTLRSPK